MRNEKRNISDPFGSPFSCFMLPPLVTESIVTVSQREFTRAVRERNVRMEHLNREPNERVGSEMEQERKGRRWQDGAGANDGRWRRER